MPIIDIPITRLASKRRTAEAVLGKPESGPSTRGSTYWRRLLACPREHFLGNVLGWTALNRTDPLEFGLLWHYILEELYAGMAQVQKGVILPESPESAAWRVLKPFDGEPGYEEGYPKLSNMLDNYLSRWYQTDLQNWEIQSIEETLAVSLEEGLGFEWSNRLDLVVVDHSLGDRVLRHVEHKTTYRMDGEVIIGYGMDLQIIGQTFLCARKYEKSQEPYLGAVVNLISRPYLNSSGEARSSADQHRMLVQPSPSDIEAWEQSMRFWQRWKATLEQIDTYPRNLNACVRRYGRCTFFNLCQSRPDDSVSSLRDLDERIRAGEASHPPGYRAAGGNDDEEG